MSRCGIFLCALLLTGLQACSSLGPNTLSEGRPAYNEAIAATNSEQYLAWIVRQRYGVPTTQLAVSSITASVRFASSAGVEIGVGPSESYAGNLVPLSGGVAYEESPTITYVPLQGEAHLRKLLSPVPLELVALLLNMNVPPGAVMAIMVRRVNGIPNPDFISHASQEGDRRFAELLALISELHRADRLSFYPTGKKPKHYHVWIHDYMPMHEKEVRELLAMLAIDDIEVDGADITLPVVGAVRRPTHRAIAFETRSVVDMGRIAAASVDVPEADRSRGFTLDFAESGLAGEFIHVRRAGQRPTTAIAATRYKDWWYYIAGDDVRSKQYFVLLQSLMTALFTEAGAGAKKPILVVPVK